MIHGDVEPDPLLREPIRCHSKSLEGVEICLQQAAREGSFGPSAAKEVVSGACRAGRLLGQ